ncbi:uncharacterized protein C8R40DRAFT_1043450, partial [Lentinula edodes]|uniref:uncharacterized protein n=1 Tax=Lentinula edodes TaxID=5353 RepID=UPI001E8E24C5
LCSMVKINGVQAFVMVDSESTADALSPNFVQITHRQPFGLENSLTPQLRCTAPHRLYNGNNGDIQDKDYFNVANIDCYDAVLGTMFMRKHGMALDFKNNTIRLHGKPIPTLTDGEENRGIAQ